MSRRKIAIRSFFIDYYDHWFDSRFEADERWFRAGNLPPYKEDAFRMMREAGIRVPSFGKADMMGMKYGPSTKVVAYYDPKGHATHGKYLTQLGDVWYPNMLVSRFIETEGPPTHTRVVHAGEKSLAFTMTSDHEWMSNTGNDIIMTFVQEGGFERHFHYPLYAIDYVDGYAVDLNRCPGLSFTPVSDRWSAKECAEAILDWAQVYDFEGNKR